MCGSLTDALQHGGSPHMYTRGRLDTVWGHVQVASGWARARGTGAWHCLSETHPPCVAVCCAAGEVQAAGLAAIRRASGGVLVGMVAWDCAMRGLSLG